MVSNRLRKQSAQVPFGIGQVGKWFDSTRKRVAINEDGTSRFIEFLGVKTLTASATLTVDDAGKLIVADSATSVVATLPAASECPGASFTLVVKQLTSSGGHAFSPAAADNIYGNGFTAADDKDAICSAATDRVGDMLRVTSDGADWAITGVTGTWAREA